MKYMRIVLLILVMALILAGCRGRDTIIGPAPISIPDVEKIYYFPILLFPQRDSHLGVDIWNRSVNKVQYLANNSIVKYVLMWNDVEAVQGIYDWTYVDTQMALVKDYPLLINIKNTPEWARRLPLYSCSSPREEYWDNFLWFVDSVVQRYSPRYIEIWNEPDVSPTFDPDWSIYFGCWGNLYSDGQYFGKFVKYITDNIASVEIMAGGFSNVRWNDFLGGFLSSNPGVDYVSFHQYAGLEFPGSFDYIFTSSEYVSTLTDIPQFITETSYTCPTSGPNPLCEDEFEQAQADYLQYILDNYGDYNISGIVWFMLANNGWVHSDLVESNVKKPVWYIYKNELEPNPYP